jgi:YidC/Oxa1 family membrane protein insertase
MKLIVAFLFLATSEAFAPVARSFVSRRAPSTSLSFGVDPSQFHDLSHHLGSLQDLQDAIASTTMSLADAEFADLAADAAEEVATDSNGWFGFLTGPISSFLQLIHSSLVAVGVNANAWGVSIIFLTVLIKVATFPLTKQQLESTNKMQAMSPAIKEIQAKYQSNPEVMNQKVAEFYQVNEINPLAGCIPSLVQIPVFIGLYRAVLELAKENKLDESFLFLPNLEGPLITNLRIPGRTVSLPWDGTPRFPFLFSPSFWSSPSMFRWS